MADLEGLACGWHITCACSLPLMPSPLPSAGAGPSAASTEKHCGLRGPSLRLEGLDLGIKFKFLPKPQRHAAPHITTLLPCVGLPPPHPHPEQGGWRSRVQALETYTPG